MSLTLAVLRAQVNSPEYVLPCAACTFLDVADFPDTLHTPLIVNWRQRGIYSLQCCSSACGLCTVELKAATASAVALAWSTHVARAAQNERNIFLFAKVRRCLHRLHRRGLVPAAFPMPAEE